MPESVSQITDIPKGRDTPPHLADDSIFDQLKLEIPLELAPISGPIYDGDAPKLFGKDFILLMSFLVFTLHGFNQLQAKTRITRAVELGYDYLRRGKLKLNAELTRSILKRPRFQEVIIGIRRIVF